MALEDDPYGGDVLLKDCVERALAPHRDRLSADSLIDLRDYLILFVTTHPAAEPLYTRLRKRPPVQKSTLVEAQRRKDTESGGENVRLVPRERRHR